MVSPDVLFTALEDYSPVLTETFFVKHPLMNAIYQSNQIKKVGLEGPFRTFGLRTGAPGTVNTIINGSETINGGRKDIGVKGREDAVRLIYAYDVPNQDLDLANGKQDIVKLLETYPEASMDDFQMRINRQIAVGDGEDVGGFVTLNGNATYAPLGVAKTGIMSFAARASQTSTVFNVPKEAAAVNPTTGWYNQREHITAFATDGLRKLRAAYFAATRQGREQGILDIGFADEATYLNLLDTYEQFVQAPVGIGNDVIAATTPDFVMFHKCKMFLEQDIEIAAAGFDSTDAEEGLVYMLNSKTWELFHASHNEYDGKGKPNLFRMRQPFRHPQQDMMRFEAVLHANIVCNNLRANAVVTGGAS